MDSVDAAAAATTDAPVLNVINKRIRNLRKKYKRIIQIEEAVAQGKSINKEQEEVLQSKIGVCVTIDELEKLRAPLSVAVSEEIDLAFQRRKQQEEEQQQVSAVADDLAAKARVTNEEEHEEVKVKATEEAVETVWNGDVEDLLNLIYFGSLFDVKMQNDFTSTMFTRTLERNCCLTYDYVTDDATDMLSEKDLSLISTLFGLVSSRPGDSSLSHKNAIQQCIEHAKHWLANSDRPIDADSSVTYAGLRERLAKILASEYVTITPEMQAPPVEIGVAGNYASYQVSGHAQVEAKDDNAENHQGHDTDNNHTRYEELQNQKEDYVILNAADANETEADEYQRDAVPKDQQFIHRRSHSNQRSGRGGGGGGYNGRGYSNGRGRHGNGRGGGPYQNGRNQSYDQQPGGNYHQKNSYNNRARVGRDGAGGNSYNNRGSAGSAGYAPVDVGSG